MKIASHRNKQLSLLWLWSWVTRERLPPTLNGVQQRLERPTIRARDTTSTASPPSPVEKKREEERREKKEKRRGDYNEGSHQVCKGYALRCGTFSLKPDK